MDGVVSDESQVKVDVLPVIILFQANSQTDWHSYGKEQQLGGQSCDNRSCYKPERGSSQPTLHLLGG